MRDLTELLPASLQRAVSLASEKGSSTWLTVLPLSEHGFALHKGAFHDTLAFIRYGWTPDRLPTKCACGSSFSVEHALSCAKGSFPSIRHNEIKNLRATLLTEVCHEVTVEPELQPVTNEVLTGPTANAQTGTAAHWGHVRCALHNCATSQSGRFQIRPLPNPATSSCMLGPCIAKFTYMHG